MASPAETWRLRAKGCAILAGNVADTYSRAQLRQTAQVWQTMAQVVETLEEINRKRAATAESRHLLPRAKQHASLSTTLSKMRELGVHELNVLCRNPACSHEITFSADDYAGDLELLWFRSRMICARCGGGRLDGRPNWKD
jgi:hypothetical protein